MEPSQRYSVEMNAATLIATAQNLATSAHAAQRDKVGRPYIEHPERVARYVREIFPWCSDEAVAVAWLHDTVEDTTLTLADLRAAGLPESVIAGVDAMSKRSGEAAEAYFERVRGDALARLVKHADLRDNTDPQRGAELDAVTRERLRQKYIVARRLLGPPPERDAVG